MRKTVPIVVLVLGLPLGTWIWARHARGRERPLVVAVTRVVDGDTIELRGLGAVRYIGIDTPELHHPRRPVQRMAVAAMQANRRLVGGRRVTVVFDRERRDVHGRLLAYVYVDGVFVNAELMRLGLARPLTIPPNTRHRGVFARLYAEARRRHVGLWGGGEGGTPWGTP